MVAIIGVIGTLTAALIGFSGVVWQTSHTQTRQSEPGRTVGHLDHKDDTPLPGSIEQIPSPDIPEKRITEQSVRPYADIAPPPQQVQTTRNLCASPGLWVVNDTPHENNTNGIPARFTGNALVVDSVDAQGTRMRMTHTCKADTHSITLGDATINIYGQTFPATNIAVFAGHYDLQSDGSFLGTSTIGLEYRIRRQ